MHRSRYHVGCYGRLVGRDVTWNFVSNKMPRPTKAFRRQKINAAAAWKRGDKPEAYKLWEKAAASLKEFQAKKRNKNKPQEGDESSEAAG